MAAKAPTQERQGEPALAQFYDYRVDEVTQPLSGASFQNYLNNRAAEGFRFKQIMGENAVIWEKDLIRAQEVVARQEAGGDSQGSASRWGSTRRATQTGEQQRITADRDSSADEAIVTISEASQATDIPLGILIRLVETGGIDFSLQEDAVYVNLSEIYACIKDAQDRMETPHQRAEMAMGLGVGARNR